jgi:hypothetical protein
MPQPVTPSSTTSKAPAVAANRANLWLMEIRLPSR